MGSFGFYLTTALALVLILEGLLYCLFPDSVRKLMAMALMLPPQKLRLFGGSLAVTGICLLLLLKNFTTH